MRDSGHNTRRAFGLVVVAALAVFATACLPPKPAPRAAPAPKGGGGAPAPAPAPAPTLTPAPGGNSASAIAVMVSDTVSKVIDFPDPSVTKVGDTYYAYSTGSGFNTLQEIKSTDLVTWTWVGDPFSGPGPYAATTTGSGWANLFANTWAPTMLELPSNPPETRYVLYYTSLSTVSGSSGKHCIGRAVSASPEGPFVDDQTKPMICDVARGGSVDPSPIVVNGHVYLSWQSFGVAATGEPTRLWTTRLTDDGLATNGTQVQNLETLGWSFEPPVIEGPSMMPSPDGGYLLFYSTGVWSTADYKMAVAYCPSPTSACTRFYSTPVLATRGTMAGPGGPAVFKDLSGNWMLAFHAWTSPYIGYKSSDARYARTFRMLPITFPSGGHKPKIG